MANYGLYVWFAYGVASFILIGNLVVTIKRMRNNKRIVSEIHK